MQKIKNWLGIKTCEHKWVVSYNSKHNGIYSTQYYIFKFCSCGKNKHLITLKYKQMHSKIEETLQGIKNKNPEYYVIGVEG